MSGLSGEYYPTITETENLVTKLEKYYGDETSLLDVQMDRVSIAFCWHRIAPTHSNALERAGDRQNDLNQWCPGGPVWPVPQTGLTGVEQRTAKT